MTKNDITNLIKILKKHYPDAKCSLNFNTPFELLVGVMLSSQSTDERVNKTTPQLFAKYKEPLDFVNANIEDIENIIRPCGFFRNKAKNIKATSSVLYERYNSLVPNTIAELIQLPGVGRKSANVIMLEAFNNPQGIAVDTHAKRISNRLGLSKQSDPSKIEQDLIKKIPKEYFYDVNHLFMWHGRKICKAPTPNCSICPIQNYCKYYKTHQKNFLCNIIGK